MNNCMVLKRFPKPDGSKPTKNNRETSSDITHWPKDAGAVPINKSTTTAAWHQRDLELTLENFTLFLNFFGPSLPTLQQTSIIKILSASTAGTLSHCCMFASLPCMHRKWLRFRVSRALPSC